MVLLWPTHILHRCYNAWIPLIKKTLTFQLFSQWTLYRKHVYIYIYIYIYIYVCISVLSRNFTFRFYLASLWLRPFLCGDRRQEVFAPFFLCIWSHFSDIVASVQEGDMLASYLSIICLDNVVHRIKENGVTLAKARGWRYPARTITDIDYVDDIDLLANTNTHAKSLLHSLEQAGGGIGFYVNADKTKFFFNQRDDICTLNGRSLKLMDKFNYLRSNVSCTENDINTRLAKSWTAINRLSFIWNSDISGKIKCIFSKQWLCQYCDIDAPHRRWLSVWRESLTAIAQECCELYWTSPGRCITQNSSCTATYLPPRKPSELDEKDMQDTTEGVRVSS